MHREHVLVTTLDRIRHRMKDVVLGPPAACHVLLYQGTANRQRARSKAARRALRPSALLLRRRLCHRWAEGEGYAGVVVCTVTPCYGRNRKLLQHMRSASPTTSPVPASAQGIWFPQVLRPEITACPPLMPCPEVEPHNSRTWARVRVLVEYRCIRSGCFSWRCPSSSCRRRRWECQALSCPLCRPVPTELD